MTLEVARGTHTCLLLLASFCPVSRLAALQPPSPAFEVATVKAAASNADPDTGTWSLPEKGNFNASHVSLGLLLQLAYGVDASQIANKPAWLDSALYDVAARPEDGIRLSREELRPRLQNLLQTRFHLVAHTEVRTVLGFALVVAKGGPTLTPTKAERTPDWRYNVSRGQMRGANWSMSSLARFLTPAAGFPVVDQTGLPGSYDIAFSYAPEGDPDSTLPTLAAALKQATGLLLKQQKVPVETVVIDSIDKVPTAN